jgi:membrane-associated phospholipid phosphatase
VTRERSPDARFGVHAVLVFVAVALVAIPFALLVVLVTSKVDALQHLDQDTADSLHGFAVDHPVFTDVMKIVSDVGTSTSWYLILAPFLVFLLYRRLFRLAAFLVVTAVGSVTLNNLVKAVVDRARPHLVDPVATAGGPSFPSGHAQAATVNCGILVLIFLPVVPRGRRRWLVLAAAAVVVLIGFSRIALGVHFLSDVVGGIVLGGAWLLVMTAVFSAWRRERHRPGVHLSEGLEPERRDDLAP